MGKEITYEDLRSRSGIHIDELQATEKGTVSGKQRRIAEFDWGQLRRSVTLNGATEIAITFADYFGVVNRNANSYDDLNGNAREFIETVERVSGVPVSLISKAFAVDGVIKRDTK